MLSRQEIFLIEDDTVKYAKIDDCMTILTIPDEIKVIGYAAFYESDIETAVIPESVEIIKPFAFANCKKLKNVIFLGDEERGLSIGHDAFTGCENLKEVKVPKKANFGLSFPMNCNIL